jgi:hypothetical protein
MIRHVININIKQWDTIRSIFKSIILEDENSHPLLEELCMYVGIAYCKCDIGFSLVDW